MGKMNEISVLAWNCGIRASFETIGELQTAVAKYVLGSGVLNKTPRTQEEKFLFDNTQALMQKLNLEDWPADELAKLCCLTCEEAATLTRGTILHHITQRNSDGTAMRVRVTGKCQTWKTRPDDFRLPVTHGLRAYGAITHANAHEWYVA